MAKATCSIDGCETEAVKRGWCGRHYLRWWKHGDPMAVLPAVRPRRDPESRFLEKVEKHGPIPIGREDLGPCWIWLAYRNEKGYGVFGLGGKSRTTSAHRWAYEHFVAPIDTGLTIDHLCRNTSCVNPAHLEPVTAAENTRRAESGQAKKTHCPLGHLYSEENTYSYHGERHCRICKIENQRARRSSALSTEEGGGS